MTCCRPYAGKTQFIVELDGAQDVLLLLGPKNLLLVPEASSSFAEGSQ